jgi:hypothetical protein
MIIFRGMRKTGASICRRPMLDNALIRQSGRRNVRVLRIIPIQGEPLKAKEYLL